MSDSFLFSIIMVLGAIHYCKVYSVRDSKSHLFAVIHGCSYIYFKFTRMFKQFLLRINDIWGYQGS